MARISANLETARAEGRLAAEFLIARIERPHEDIARRELTLECNLIVRASTAPRSKAPAKGSRS